MVDQYGKTILDMLVAEVYECVFSISWCNIYIIDLPREIDTCGQYLMLPRHLVIPQFVWGYLMMNFLVLCVLFL